MIRRDEIEPYHTCEAYTSEEQAKEAEQGEDNTAGAFRWMELEDWE